MQYFVVNGDFFIFRKKSTKCYSNLFKVLPRRKHLHERIRHVLLKVYEKKAFLIMFYCYLLRRPLYFLQNVKGFSKICWKKCQFLKEKA